MAVPLGAQTAATNAAIISAGLVRGIPGSTVSVPLTLSHTGSVSAVQYDLSYNPARMTAGTLAQGVFSNDVVLRSRQVAPGTHRILVYQTSPSVLDTNLAIGGLPFTLPAGQLSGGGRVTITNALAASQTATAVSPLRLRHGAVLADPVFRGPDGVVDLFLTVQSNLLYVVQASTNLVNWVNIATNFTALDYILITDFDAVQYQARFYRAVPVGTPAGGTISNVSVTAGNLLTFGYATTAGQTYILQTSTNLASWDNLTTNVAGASVLSFTNLIAPAVPRQFFRVLKLP